MSDGWGVGDKADAPAFDTIKEGELIFGEHPHSRQDNNIYLRRKDGSIEDFDGFRRRIDIDIKSTNYLKESEYSGDQVRKRVIGKIIVDDIPLVEEFGRDPVEIMRRLERLVTEYSEHPSGWFNKKDRDGLVGRKIWYHDQPATIQSLIEDQGCIMIALEPGAKAPERDRDEDEEDPWEDWLEGDHYVVKDEVLSPHIWWWRN